MQINKWLIVVVALVLLTGCQKDENKALNTDIKVHEERDDTPEEESRRHIEEEAIDSSVSVAAGMSEIDRVQSEVKSQLERVINKANLLPEDLKGTQVDATK